jgi:protein SCO1/2
MLDFSCLKIAIALCAAIALAACNRPAPSSESRAQQYETRGIVRGLSPDLKTVDIQHENIPGFMPSMTMPFTASNQKELADLKIGDAISFRLTVTEKDFAIDRVKKIPANQVQVPAATPTPVDSSVGAARLREGDEMPAFTLTDQDGKHITRETFRGAPFVLTFVFTRCPVPTFCPRISDNFGQLQSAIKTGGAGALTKTRLLSVTLDPAFDTPQVLKEYGASHQADPQVWTFATGDPKQIDALTRGFSVYRQTEGGTISHGLATALLDKDGRIEKIWRGNGWTPAEVGQQINRRAE